jgi:hypothetical protein
MKLNRVLMIMATCTMLTATFTWQSPSASSAPAALVSSEWAAVQKVTDPWDARTVLSFVDQAIGADAIRDETLLRLTPDQFLSYQEGHPAYLMAAIQDFYGPHYRQLASTGQAAYIIEGINQSDLLLDLNGLTSDQAGALIAQVCTGPLATWYLVHEVPLPVPTAQGPSRQSTSSADRPIFPPQGVFTVPTAIIAGASYNTRTEVHPIPQRGQLFVEAMVDASAASAAYAENQALGSFRAFTHLRTSKSQLPREICVWDTEGGGAFKNGDPLYGGIGIGFTYRNVQFEVSWTVLAGHYPLPRTSHGPVDPKAVDRAQALAQWLYDRAADYAKQPPARGGTSLPGGRAPTAIPAQAEARWSAALPSNNGAWRGWPEPRSVLRCSRHSKRFLYGGSRRSERLQSGRMHNRHAFRWACCPHVPVSVDVFPGAEGSARRWYRRPVLAVQTY